MLQVDVEVTGAGAAERLQRRIEIANVGGGALADYRVRELGCDGGMLVEVRLIGYPRWAEAVGGLVARAFDALGYGAAFDSEGLSDIASVRAETCLVAGGGGAPRVLDGWRLSLQGTSGALDVWNDRSAVRQSAAVALRPYRELNALILQAQCLAVWGQPRLPSWPEALMVPIRKEGDVPYVRIEDIPEPAAGEFDKRMWHSTVPVIPGEGLCFYAWDWLDFLAGGR